MSDKPQGPGWWLASDGTWYPPELHPSVQEVTPAPVATAPVAVTPLPDAAAPVAVVPVPDVVRDADRPVATVEMPPLGPVGPVAPRAVPSLPVGDRKPTWSGETDRRTEAGPMFPNLFEQAVAGSALANAVTVNFADGEHRESLDVPQQSVPPAETRVLVSPDGRVPAEVGAFMGASAKKRRWRH